MNECLVTGIAQTSDSGELEKLVSGLGLDASRAAAITKQNAQTLGHHDAGRGTFQAGTSIMTGGGGTGVPGIGGSGGSLSSTSHGAVPNYLGGLPLIPAGQAEHFNIAIAEGRSLVTYKANSAEEAEQAEASFRQAGLRNVKVFKPKVSA